MHDSLFFRMTWGALGFLSDLVAAFNLPLWTDERRSYTGLWLLSLFCGISGLDQWYLGREGRAWAKFLTLGGMGIWWLWDLGVVLVNRATREAGTPVQGTAAQRITALAVTLASFGAGAWFLVRPQLGF